MQRTNLSKPKTTSRSSYLQKQSVGKSAAKHPLMALHQSIGNRALQRVMQSSYVQAKLQVGPPGDRFEQEADHVADNVMRMPDAQVNPSAMISNRTQLSRLQRQCSECEEKVQPQELKEEEEPVQVQGKAAEGGGNQVSQGVQSQIESFRGGGQQLPSTLRAYFEPRFGNDFGGVRLHTGTQAAEVARSINARAFTVGPDVAFGAGQYSPETSGGKRLLAHELAHVVQQGAASQQTKVIQRAFNSDDNHNLQSERFSGNDRLENIFDEKQEEFLRSGSRGDAVVKVQQTLIELGFLLPRFGADGKFGDETGNAVSKFKVENGISPSDPVVGPKTIGALDTELLKGGGIKPPPVPTCPDGPVNMEAEPLPPIPAPSITRMNAIEMFELVKKRQKPGSFIPPKPPLGATVPTIENLKPVTVTTEPIASENCLKCIADWELPQPKVEIFIASGDFSDEPKRSFPVQDQSVSGCPFETGGTFKDVIKRILPEAEPSILDAELEHWSDLVLSHLLITGRYLSNVRRLTPARSHLRGNSLGECVNKVNQFLVETTTTIVPVAVPFYGRLAGEAVTAVSSDTTIKRENDHSADSVPPIDKKPIFPNIDRDINPFTCNAFFRKFDKSIGLKLPGPPFSSIMVDKEGDIPPAQPWNTL